MWLINSAAAPAVPRSRSADDRVFLIVIRSNRAGGGSIAYTWRGKLIISDSGLDWVVIDDACRLLLNVTRTRVRWLLLRFISSDLPAPRDHLLDLDQLSLPGRHCHLWRLIVLKGGAFQSDTDWYFYDKLPFGANMHYSTKIEAFTTKFVL